MPKLNATHAKQALEYAKTPASIEHWTALATDFGGLSKFNLLKGRNLTFLLGAGMLIRFFGIGGTRVLVDWNDKTKDDETRRRQTAERVFVEVAGTWIATYMALQLGMDVSGKALTGLSQLAAPALERWANTPGMQAALTSRNPLKKLGAWLLKPRSLSPTVLLKRAEALKAKGVLKQQDLESLAAAVVKTTDRHNPFSLGLNSVERNALGDWNSSKFSNALKEANASHLYHETVLPNGTVKTSGVLNQDKAVESYFARTNVAGVASSIMGGVFSAWLSGGPIQRANDVVFRPWYLHRLKLAEQKKKQDALHHDVRPAVAESAPDEHGGTMASWQKVAATKAVLHQLGSQPPAMPAHPALYAPTRKASNGGVRV